MKILVVVDSININDSSGSKANVALIKNLTQAGFEVKVYHYTQKNIDLQGVVCVSIPEKKWSLLFVLSRLQRVFTRITGIHIHRFLEEVFGFSFTFFNDTDSIVSALKKENSFNPDLVLTLSKAASFRPHYAVLQLPNWHQKWMAYVHDPYPFHFYPRPYTWVEQGHRQKERFFQKVSEKAQYAAFPSLLLKDWIGSFFPEFLAKGLVIPHQLSKNSGDEMFNFHSEFEECQSEPTECQTESTECKTEPVECQTKPVECQSEPVECQSEPVEDFLSYFNSNSFTLLHAGNLLKQRNPLFLIQAFKLFLEKNPDAKETAQLVLVGPAGYHEKEIEAEKTQNENMVFINKNVPFNKVQAMQQKASVTVILEAKSEISPFLPGKFPHCIEANKPILLLGPFYSETRRLLGHEYPYWAELDEVEKITEIIEILYQQWKQNPDDLILNRSDLYDYLSEDYLKKIIIGLQNNL